MSGQVSRGSAGEYQAVERAGVAFKPLNLGYSVTAAHMDSGGNLLGFKFTDLNFIHILKVPSLQYLECGLTQNSIP